MAELDLDFLSIEIFTDEDTSEWTCNAAISDYTQFESINLKDSFSVTLLDETWDFVVVSKQLNRSAPANNQFTLVGKTPTILLNPPYSAAIDLINSVDTSAKELVQTLLQTNALDWQLKDLDNLELDWYLNKFSLAESASNATDTARKIVNAAGGVLECTPQGGWIIRHLYPISPLSYDTIVPDHFFTDIDNILASSHQYDANKLYDWVRIRNTTQSAPSDTTEIIFDEGTNLIGTVKVYPYPYRDIGLVTTASDLVITIDQTSKVEEIRIETEELVEFAKGVASVKYPVYALVSVAWQDVDLKGIEFEIDTRTLYSTDPEQSYSLAWVTYKTRCYTWRVWSEKEYDAQFLVVELDE